MQNKKMKVRLGSTSFINFFGQVAATRAKPSSSWRDIAIARNMTSTPLSFNGVGLRYLSAMARVGETAVDAEFAMAKTSGWWDIENCTVPKGCDAHAITKNLRLALLKINYLGVLSIYAYGDTNRISPSVQQALSSTGVSLNHVPSGVKDGSDKKIIVDMLLWAMENEAPANIMLISGDGDFSYVLHKLRMRKYNILLFRPDENTSSPYLIGAANIVMPYRSIVAASSGSDEVCKQAQPSKPSKHKKSELEVLNQRAWFCKKCNVTHLYHLYGKKHKKKATVAAPKTLRCKICQVNVPKGGNEVHISGRKHKNKVKVQAGDSL